MNDLTKDEILAHFLSLHNALGTQESNPDKEEFDKRHTKIWAKCDEELNKRLVKLQAKDTPTPEETKELAALKDYLKLY